MSRVSSPVLAPARLADAALVVVFLALTFLLGVFPLKDVDFWWHLRTGDLIRQTGQIPHRDIYTYTVPDHAWIDLHWGFQVLLSWGYQHGGVVGLNLAKCTITCAAVLLLLSARRRDWPLGAMLVAWLPALILLGGRMYVRPETLTLLYLSAFLAVLARWELTPGLAFVLPVVQVLWVNTQGLFVLGPVVLAFALIDAALQPGAFARARRPWWRAIGIAAALTVLACLANPYGIVGALFPVQLAGTMSNPIFRSTIAELTPIPEFIRRDGGLYNFMIRLHLTVMALGAFSFLVPLVWRGVVRMLPDGPRPDIRRDDKKTRKKEAQAKRPRQTEQGWRVSGGRGAVRAVPPGGSDGASPSKGDGTPDRRVRTSKRRSAAERAREESWTLSPFRLLLFAAFSALSLQATRNSHQFAAVVGAVTAWNFGEWGAALRRRRRRGESAGLVLRLAALGCLVLAFAGVASGGLYALAEEGRNIGLGEEPVWFPKAAVAFAGRPELPPRFLSFHNGHAALYAYGFGPERKVFADPRLEVMGPEHYERYTTLHRDIIEDRPGWPEALDAAGRPVVLVDHAHNVRTGVTLLADPLWRCVWFDAVAAVFLHQTVAAEAGASAVDFAGRHFRGEEAGAPGGLRERLAWAKALGHYALRMQVKGRPDLAHALVLLGRDHARRARQADPSAAEAWSSLALLEWAREPALGSEPIPRFRRPLDPVFDLAAARVTYLGREALARAPDDALVLSLLAHSFQARGMDEAALPLLARQAAARPKTLEQVRERAHAAAMRDLVRARLGPMPAPSVENGSELERSITALLARGRAASAAALIAREVPARSRSWTRADGLATLWLHLGEPARARTAWAEVASPPRPALRSARIALTYLVEDDLDPARRFYREALAVEPELFEAHYGLALLEQDAGRAAAGLTSARLALAHAPSDVARAAAQAIVTAVEPYAEDPARTHRQGVKGAERKPRKSP